MVSLTIINSPLHEREEALASTVRGFFLRRRPLWPWVDTPILSDLDPSRFCIFCCPADTALAALQCYFVGSFAALIWDLYWGTYGDNGWGLRARRPAWCS